MNKIDSFRGEFDFLSNFYPAELVYKGIFYPTAEHAYMAGKTLLTSERMLIASLDTPKAAKSYGRKLALRPNWEDIKLSIMKDVVERKFLHNNDLLEKLLSTGDSHLEEGNWWGDVYWGVCNGVGENNLGKILMQTRENLGALRN
jgi:ribA/ribD-fused uncharacterized protein